ncbi:Nucleotide-binding universal stress protein, UspA family [Salegentibacter holothuriorum]|uniref:Nucleotide-binding universal stress protein, UspA family n=1 Tax=Salegentibacter holothuriorum TaxID=241145 RepID=A0A1T5BIU6_9FLAO|nr:universal stress protein [Salegentibacter holothuriorum]SKB47201.1 Nucleotide-binding universal stress protein, UspA family [Salegentibacter holothuriorum]
MKKILVPTDFSDTAEHALKIAAHLAKKHQSEIYLLHMLELPMQLIDPVGGGNSQNLPESLFFMKLAHQRFTKLMAKPFLKDIKVHETVMFHQAFNGIMEVSEEYKCDIIIMGSHGASGFKEMFIGSNTEKVVRSSNIPVLVIKNEHEKFEIENFIFATDADTNDKRTLEAAYDFSKLTEAKFHILFINTPNNFITSTEVRKRIENFVSNTKVKDFKIHIYNDISVEKGILSFALKKQKTLIGIGTHGHKGLAHFFNGSISEDLVNHANMPVVTFKI